jgi:hypothetical protein
MKKPKRIVIGELFTFILIKSKFTHEQIAEHFIIPVDLVNLDLSILAFNYANDHKGLPTKEQREDIHKKLLKGLRNKDGINETEKNSKDFLNLN